MTSEQRDLILKLVVYPEGGQRITPEEFLEQFGAKDGQVLGLELLRDAMARRDALDVEMAFIVSGTFGITEDHLELLLLLASADWHRNHEYVATLLGRFAGVEVVEALYELTQRVPEYLDFDESRALARKAVHALGEIPGQEANGVLRRLADSDSEIIRERAIRQLRKRRGDDPY